MAENDGHNEGRIRTYLASHGGSVADPGGRGLTDEMARQLGIDKPAVLSAVLLQMESAGVITREMRGLRTMRISLASGAAPEPAATEAAAPVAAAPVAAAPVAGSGGEPTTSLRGLRGRATVSVADPPGGEEPSGKAVPLREALTRRSHDAPAPAATVPAPAPVAAVSGLAPAEGPAPDATGQSGARAVSLRDAISRQTVAVGTEVVDGAPVSAPNRRTAPGASSPPSSLSSLSTLSSLSNPRTTTSFPGPGARPSDGFVDRFASPQDATPFLPPAPPPRTFVSDTGPDKKEGKRRPKGGGIRGLQRSITTAPLEVRAEPTKNIVGAVGLAVAGLIIVALITIVVAKGASQKVVSPGVTSSSSDACNVVTSAMASTALGVDAGPPNYVLGDCVYGDGVVHELIVQVFRQDAKSLFDNGRTSSALDVANVGDAAYYVDGGMRVLKGSSLLEITLGPTPASSPTPAVLALTTLAVARL